MHTILFDVLQSSGHCESLPLPFDVELVSLGGGLKLIHQGDLVCVVALAADVVVLMDAIGLEKKLQLNESFCLDRGLELFLRRTNVRVRLFDVITVTSLELEGVATVMDMSSDDDVATVPIVDDIEEMPFIVTATVVSRYFHLGQCNRFLFQKAAGTNGGLASAWTDAMFEKGIVFENDIRSSLLRDAFLKEFHGKSIGNWLALVELANHAIEHSLSGKKIFASSIRFAPHDNAFETYLSSSHLFVCATMELDFIELTVSENTVTLHLIDSKCSSHVKTYHIVQVAYYAIVLEYFLSLSLIRESVEHAIGTKWKIVVSPVRIIFFFV